MREGPPATRRRRRPLPPRLVEAKPLDRGLEPFVVEEPVEVRVDEESRAPFRAVLVDERERRRGDLVRVDPEPFGEAPNEPVFPAPSGPRRADESSGDEEEGRGSRPTSRVSSTERATASNGTLFTAGATRRRPRRRGRGSSKGEVRSPEGSPRRGAPLRVARQAVEVGPRRGGLHAVRPRARSAPTMPVRTSPLPPVARPGLPDGTRARRPAGVATTDRNPFRTTVAPDSAARRRAALSGSPDGRCGAAEEAGRLPG